jgi:Protein of unknown function (DUF1838)
MSKRLSILVFALAFSAASYAQKQQKKLDLDKPEDNFTAYLKMRLSLKEGEEVVYYWTGVVYNYLPGERGQALFGLEACNVAKMVKVDSVYQMLTREVALYKDLKTGQYLDRWYNPMIKDSVDVVHVWNDPVNQTLALKSRFGPWGVPWTRLGDGRISMNSDIFLLYPSPLKKADFPENSRSDQYQAAELFQFFMNEKDLNNPKLNSCYSEVSWTRISDFLPWLRMGDRPGHLVYQCRGYKIMGGSSEKLPSVFREYVRSKHPEFLDPPEKFSAPNMTSWRYFKKLKDEKKIK